MDSHLFRLNVELKTVKSPGTQLKNPLKSVIVAQQKELFVVMRHKVVARMKSVALTMRLGSYVIKCTEIFVLEFCIK